MVVVDANVITVGLPSRSDALRRLPIRLVVMDTATEAVQCLRDERIDTVVSHWDLVDMPQGRFLRRVITAKPWIPTISFVPTGNDSSEIAARAAGVSAVLTDGTNDTIFRRTVCQLLGIPTFARIRTMCSVGIETDRRLEAEPILENKFEPSSFLRSGFGDRPVMAVVESGERRRGRRAANLYEAPGASDIRTV